MAKTVDYTAPVCDTICKTWANAIFKHKTPSGKYCSDYNVAMKELISSLKEDGVLDSIEVYENKMIDDISKLNNPPKSRQDCYDDLLDLVEMTSDFSRMATHPSGSLLQYKLKCNELTDKLIKKAGRFRMKYGETLQLGENND